MATQKYYLSVDDAGTSRWYSDNEFHVLHRINGPAVEYTSGHKEWYQNGQRHRTDGPAIEWVNGERRWYQFGLLHRDDGPAIEYADGGKCWWINGQLHRTDGPAVEWADGRKHWYINDTRLSEEDFLAATQPVIEMTVADIERLLGKRVKIVK